MPKFVQVDIDDIQYADVNPKLHDLQSLADSETRYGFVEIPIVNESTNKLVAGQGRIDALKALKKAGKPAPEGVTVKRGKWLVDVRVFPFKSDAEAQAYLFDSNNLALAGGDFTAWDMERLWDPEAYKATLKMLGEQNVLPVSVDGDSLDALLLPPTNPTAEWQGMPEYESKDLTAWKTVYIHFRSLEGLLQFAMLIGQKMTEDTRAIWYPPDEILHSLTVVDEDEP